MATQRSWRKVLNGFVKALRIQSREETAGLGEIGTELHLWDSQRRIVNEIAAGMDDGIRTFYVLKSRQLGSTTIMVIILLFWLALHPRTKGALVVDRPETRDDFRETIRNIILSIPARYFGGAFGIRHKADNRTFMGFTNGSQLNFLVAGTSNRNENWGESKGYSVVVLSEVAKYGSEQGLLNFLEALSNDNPDRLYVYESPLAIDTPIPTPGGWTEMGSIRPGDRVFDEAGQPCNVVGTSKVFEDRKCYRVEFDNGDHIIADGEHTWRVIERRWPTNPQWRVRELPTVALTPGRHFIDVTQPLNLPEADLPIDPYLLGAWLGDGATAEPRITAAWDDLDAIVGELSARGCQIGTITASHNKAPMFHVLGVRNLFIQLGLLGHKHIPPSYLRASERQRRDLLAGLMDTDGSIHRKNFACNFTSTLPELMDNVGELLSTLGIKYVRSMNSEEGRTRSFPQGHTSVCKASERFLFSEMPTRRVFSLPRKQSVHQAPRDHVWRKSKRLGITSVAEVASVPVKCIAVDSPSHLFLAGRTMIPTHNTANGPNHWERMWKEAIDDPFSIRRIFVGWWSKELNLVKKTDPKFHMFGLAPPDERERERIRIVKEKYSHDITVEQLAWFRWRLSQPGQTERALLQNQPWFDTEAFVLSGKSFFHIRTIAQNYEWLDQTDMGLYEGYRFWLGNDFWSTKVEHITEQLRQKEIEFRVWEQPVADGRYVIGCDPAGGSDDKNDRHVVSVWRCYGDKLDQCAEYADNIADTRQCAWVLAYVAGIYKNCLVNIELSGGYGNTVLIEFEHLRELLRASQNSGRMFLTGMESNEFLDAIRWFIYRRPDNPASAGYTINTKTNGDIKREILNGFRDSHVLGELIIRSKPLLGEMQIVVQEASSIGASGNQKDDRVMAACFARDAWVKHERSGLLMAGETYKAVKDRESGDHPGRDMINNIVKQYFLQIQNGQVDEQMTPAQAWLQERGLV